MYLMKILNVLLYTLVLTKVCFSGDQTNSYLSSFPKNFIFGTASSSYQYEGAYLSDDKGLSNWDIFTHEPGNIIDGSNGDIAVDHYHRYPEDIELMEHLGVSSFRLSISWARILPRGKFGNISMRGIRHYNELIDVLLHRGIQPFVTLSHYDIPQELEDRYESWLSSRVQDDFKYYANICFKYFGDRVKYWVTFNEPNIVATYGYRSGVHPPSRCSGSYGNCSYGDSLKEPLIVAHNIILSHAIAVTVYRTKYQKIQGGSIGIIMNTRWFEAYSNSSEDKLAAERAQSFYMNWFLDPIIYGKYPAEMQQILGSLLPTFKKKDLDNLRNSLDFIGINHYTSLYAKDCIYSACDIKSDIARAEGYVLKTAFKNGIPIGDPTDADWINIYPQGMEKILIYVKERYPNTPMFITENGLGDLNQGNTSMNLFDDKRVEYLNDYLDSAAKAIRKGADVRGYFVWSLLDNFEWTSGYTLRFGLYHVDYATLKRSLKSSATWYKQLIINYKGLQELTKEKTD